MCTHVIILSNAHLSDYRADSKLITIAYNALYQQAKHLCPLFIDHQTILKHFCFGNINSLMYVCRLKLETVHFVDHFKNVRNCLQVQYICENIKQFWHYVQAHIKTHSSYLNDRIIRIEIIEVVLYINQKSYIVYLMMILIWKLDRFCQIRCKPFTIQCKYLMEENFGEFLIRNFWWVKLCKFFLVCYIYVM